MEEARRALFERVIKKYTLADVVKHRKLGSGQRNLVELVSRYPGQGLHFKVYKKTWQEDSFFHVRRIQMFVSIATAVFRPERWHVNNLVDVDFVTERTLRALLGP